MAGSRHLHRLPDQEEDVPWRPVAGGKQLPVATTLGVLIAQAAVFAAVWAAHYWCVIVPDEKTMLQEKQDLQSLLADAQRHRHRRDLHPSDEHPGRSEGIDASFEGKPFAQISGTLAHDWPKMYGKVPEKTIWTYWYDESTCPSSENCTLPAALELCTMTVKKHRSSFQYKLLHQDEVADYVSLYELPIHWKQLPLPQQRDALMNALLARYGGVALDISVILLRHIDDYWEEMVSRNASFFGYVYRLNGMSWWNAESLATWFMMSRREGFFSTAVRHQILAMGDENTTEGLFSKPENAFGDETLLPILRTFDVKLPLCSRDSWLLEPASHCPESGHKPGQMKDSPNLPRRNDTRFILRDPRDGPLLPFAAFGWLWDVHNFSMPLQLPKPPGDMPPLNAPGGPMYMEDCSSMGTCWKEVFLKRFNEETQGSARRLSFVKLPLHVLQTEGILTQDIFAATHSFLYNWLNLAGLP